jgi:hypothetical protein
MPYKNASDRAASLARLAERKSAEALKLAADEERWAEEDRAWLLIDKELDRKDRLAHEVRRAARGQHPERQINGTTTMVDNPEPEFITSPRPPRPVRPRSLTLEERVHVLEEQVAEFHAPPA